MGEKSGGGVERKEVLCKRPEGPQALVAQEDSRRCSFLFKTPFVNTRYLLCPVTISSGQMNIHACCWEVLLSSNSSICWCLQGRRQNRSQEVGTRYWWVSCPHRSNTIKRELDGLLFTKKFTDNCEIKWTWPDRYKCLCRLGSECNV